MNAKIELNDEGLRECPNPKCGEVRQVQNLGCGGQWCVVCWVCGMDGPTGNSILDGRNKWNDLPRINDFREVFLKMLSEITVSHLLEDLLKIEHGCDMRDLDWFIKNVKEHRENKLGITSNDLGVREYWHGKADEKLWKSVENYID